MNFSLIENDTEEEEMEIKVLPKTEADRRSYFARWFEMVAPESKIREDEYFWPNGCALEPDYFESQSDLDQYLDKREYRQPELWNDNYDDLAAPSLHLSISDSSDVSETVEILPMAPEMSDWSVFPKLQPLPSDSTVDTVADLQPSSLDRHQSDWSLMPILEPLWLRKIKEDLPSEMSSLASFEDAPDLAELDNWPAMSRETSDWSRMPTLRPLSEFLDDKKTDEFDLLTPPLARETSEWSDVPSIVPEQVFEDLDANWADEVKESQPAQYHHVHHWDGPADNVWQQPIMTSMDQLIALPFMILASSTQ